MSFWKFMSFCTYLHRRGGVTEGQNEQNFIPSVAMRQPPLKRWAAIALAGFLNPLPASCFFRTEGQNVHIFSLFLRVSFFRQKDRIIMAKATELQLDSLLILIDRST